MKTTEIVPLSPAGPLMDPGSPEFREHVEAGATELARVFRESTEALRRHWDGMRAASDALEAAFRGVTGERHWLNHFEVDAYYDGERHSERYDRSKSAIDPIIKKMNTRAWALLIDKMGIKNVMSIKRREEFDKQIEKGDVPEVTEANIIGVIMGLADRAAEFATDAAKETLALLTPSHGDYKTNSGFKVGRRVVLARYVERSWDGGFRANYYRDASLIAIDGTFHILDGRGPVRDRESPLVAAIKAAGRDGRGETDYFKFRCFKNGNLHVEFRRLDLVKNLNGLATGEYVLGQDID